MSIYTEALTSLSEKDQEAILAYQEGALNMQRNEVPDSTVAIEDILNEVPGARKALARYDLKVGELMRARRNETEVLKSE